MTAFGALAARAPRLAKTLTAGAATLAVLAVANAALARRAERRHPPRGRTLTLDGARLHFVERGDGPPLLMLHGNGSMIEDFETSGLVAAAARDHRVIAFDRPGFGRSGRPRGRHWTPDAQADLLAEALERIGAPPVLALGHSWGTAVALALARRHPARVRGLVLVSGYYYPSMRPDFALLSAPAAPVIGDALRHTVLPLLSRAIWPLLMRKIFGPRRVPPAFKGFPMEMAVRPSQLRAAAEETGLLIPAVAAAQGGYGAIRAPVALVAGAEDRLVDPLDQTGRLHDAIPHSTLRLVPGHGHMVHQTAPDAVLEAIDEVTRARLAA